MFYFVIYHLLIAINTGLLQQSFSQSFKIKNRVDSDQTNNPDDKNLSWRRESDPWPPHYQCDALPPEPRQQHVTLFRATLDILLNFKLNVKHHFINLTAPIIPASFRSSAASTDKPIAKLGITPLSTFSLTLLTKSSFCLDTPPPKIIISGLKVWTSHTSAADM